MGALYVAFPVMAALLLAGPLRRAGAPLVVIALLGALGLLIVGVGVLQASVHIRTSVGAGEVRIALWPVWRRILPVAAVQVERSTASPAQWGGVGLRRGREEASRRQRALIFGAGPALVLTDRRDGMHYVVRTNEPDSFERALRAAA